MTLHTCGLIISNNQKDHSSFPCPILYHQLENLKERAEGLCGEVERPRRVVRGYHQFNGQLVQVKASTQNLLLEAGIRPTDRQVF